MNDPIQHKIDLKLASGAILTLLYFSDRDMRWIFSYNYVGEKTPGAAPEVINKVRLVANYAAGLLTPQLVLSMHVVIPARLGHQFFAGVDISPGGKTYLEFNYERVGHAYQLVEICKGARERVRLDTLEPALVKQIEFPFPVLDRIPDVFGTFHIPFRTHTGTPADFELPMRTLR